MEVFPSASLLFVPPVRIQLLLESILFHIPGLRLTVAARNLCAFKAEPA